MNAKDAVSKAIERLENMTDEEKNEIFDKVDRNMREDWEAHQKWLHANFPEELELLEKIKEADPDNGWDFSSEGFWSCRYYPARIEPEESDKGTEYKATFEDNGAICTKRFSKIKDAVEWLKPLYELRDRYEEDMREYARLWG